MSTFETWVAYPPQQRLSLPQPQLHLDAAPFFCRPQYFIEQETQQPVAFFMALHLSSQPGVLQIESLHVFKWITDINIMLSKHIQQMAQQSGCHKVLWRSVTLLGDDLFYPTTGFCTSPNNPPSEGCFWPHGTGSLVYQAAIWRLNITPIKPSACHVQPLAKVATPPPWPWYAIGERIQVANRSGQALFTCRIYPNLYPVIRSYGRLPALIYPEDVEVSQCRIEIESPQAQWEPDTLAAVSAYLGQQGYQQCEITSPIDCHWLAKPTWNGVLQGEIQEWAMAVKT